MTTEKLKILTYANPTMASSRRCFSAKIPTVTEKTRHLINYHINLGKHIQESFKNELNNIDKSLNVQHEKQQNAADMMSLDDIELDTCGGNGSKTPVQQHSVKELRHGQVITNTFVIASKLQHR